MIRLAPHLRLISYAAAITAGFWLGWQLRGAVDASRLKQALAAQQTALLRQCADDKKLTSEVSHAFQHQLSAAHARLAELKRMQPAACVPVARAAAGRDGRAGGGEHDRTDGVTDHALYDYAALAERYRLQLTGCQDFIRRTWDARHQGQ